MGYSEKDGYQITPTNAPDAPVAYDTIALAHERIQALRDERVLQRDEAQNRLHFLQRECDALDCACNALIETRKTIDSWKHDVQTVASPRYG